MSYNLVDPTTGDLTRVAGGGSSLQVGTLIQQYKKKPMSGYLYCDGSTFDENAYPALYMYLGTNVLPDYRECVMVGAEQNTTDTIATHDVYGEGEFKDDQLQEHNHIISTQNSGKYTGSYSIVGRSDSLGADTIDKETSLPTNARTDTTTHGKQKAVYVYIKATSGLAENQQENVLKDVKDYVDNSIHDKVGTAQIIGFKTNLLNQCYGYYTMGNNKVSVHMKFVLSRALNDWETLTNANLPVPSSAVTKNANGKTGAPNSVYINTDGSMQQAGGGGMPAGTYEFDFEYTTA